MRDDLRDKKVEVEPFNIPEINNLTIDKIFVCFMTCFKKGSFSFILIGIYRTPDYNFDDPFLGKLEMAMETLLKTHQNIIFAGDLNFDVLKQSKTHSKLTETLKQYNMYYLVKFPTLVTTESKSAIDNILTNIPQIKLSISGVVTEQSDHEAQLLEIKLLIN